MKLWNRHVSTSGSRRSSRAFCAPQETLLGGEETIARGIKYVEAVWISPRLWNHERPWNSNLNNSTFFVILCWPTRIEKSVKRSRSFYHVVICSCMYFLHYKVSRFHPAREWDIEAILRYIQSARFKKKIVCHNMTAELDSNWWLKMDLKLSSHTLRPNHNILVMN